MKKALLLLCLLLPLGCLLVRWPTLPVRVPLHFSSNGADVYGDKYVLWGIVLVPLLVYVASQVGYRQKTQPQPSRSIGLGVAVLLSIVLCIWLVAGIPTV
jgi:hypothetical protein